MSAKLHSLTKLWFQRWIVGLWQCVQCGSAIVLKNVRWAKNKKHRVGLRVGSLVLSIFRFSVLSQWFTFQFSVCRRLFLTLGGNVLQLPAGRGLGKFSPFWKTKPLLAGRCCYAAFTLFFLIALNSFALLINSSSIS